MPTTEIACWLCGWQGTRPHSPTDTASLFRCPNCFSLGDLSKAVREALRRAGQSVTAVVDDRQSRSARDDRKP